MLNILLSTTFLLCLTLIPMTAIALDRGSSGDADKTGLFGTVQAGTIMIRSDDKLFAELKNKRINEYSEDKEEQVFRSSLSLLLNYKTLSGTKYYCGSPGEEIEPKIVLGVAQTFSDKSILDIAVDYQFQSSVWKDPYVTGIDREATPVTRYGARLKYDRIFGSGLKFQYRYTRQDVDEDIIGERLPDLKRDGDIHKIDFGGGLRFGNTHVLSPSFSYTRGDMKGESNSYDGYGGKLQYKTNWENLAFGLNLMIDQKEYKKTDPIFLEKREDKELTAMTMLTWMNPLGYERFFINFGTGFRRQYSNIDFYDSRTTFGFVKTGYGF